ncbi:MAG: hypothetical protein EBS53_00750 [Bacteroidetes bacterium]|nr:hypothetical protein [Bacteroidota bacterium]
MFNLYSYIPAIKTTGAECKAYEKLPASVKDNILPLFELTKSRTSASNGLGDIRKNIEKIKSMMEGRPFILDTTKEFGLENPEINSFSEIANGYKNWCSFLKEVVLPDLKDVVPCVQINLSSNLSFEKWKRELQAQLNFLENNFNYLCLRINSEEFTSESVNFLLEDVTSLLNTPSKHIFIMDLKYLSNDSYTDKFSNTQIVIQNLSNQTNGFRNIAILGSSFPKSTPDTISGEIELKEVKLFTAIEKQFLGDKINLIYSDYCSIHPTRYQTGGAGFTPRIDYPLNEQISFYKDRFKVKGLKIKEISEAYQICAKSIVKKHLPKDALNISDVWGEEEILIAANEKPRGNSPSYWIAVRANIHIIRQYERLGYGLI